MEIKIGLDNGICQQLTQHLSFLLADTYILYAKTQSFHWNIQDPRFYSLHLFLEKQYHELAQALDEIAERIRMLGQPVQSTLKKYLSMTSLKETLDGELSGDDMLQELFKDHETLCSYIRGRIELVGKLGDEGTADLLIQRLRSHEKAAWMLRSHLYTIPLE